LNKKSDLENIDFPKIVHEQNARIFNTVYSILGDEADAEDVVQEVFLRAYQSLRGFRGNADISTWLYRIAMNAVSDHMRKNGRNARMCGPLNAGEQETLERALRDGDNPENLYCKKELGETVQKALAGLPAKMRMVLVLKEFNGYSYKEISKILGISIGTVESRLYRAREMLRNDIMKISGKPW
jgi:RNA polymerase sigma-70 factor, ECF subfamily